MLSFIVRRTRPVVSIFSRCGCQALVSISRMSRKNGLLYKKKNVRASYLLFITEKKIFLYDFIQSSQTRSSMYYGIRDLLHKFAVLYFICLIMQLDLSVPESC